MEGLLGVRYWVKWLNMLNLIFLGGYLGRYIGLDFRREVKVRIKKCGGILCWY